MSTPTPPVAGFDPAGPLVPHPQGGLDAWNRAFADVWRRSWRSLGAIFLVTFAVPQVAAAVVLDRHAAAGLLLPGLPLPAPEGLVPPGGGGPALLGVVLLVTLVTMFVNAIGWGAGIWAVTQTGCGLPARLGPALAAGLSRVWPLFGWYLLYSVLVTLGILACLLPGVYVGCAGALFSFAVVYEPGRNAFGRSLWLVHKSFGTVLGRVMLLVLLMLLAACAVGAVASVTGMAPTGASAGNAVAVAVVDSAVAVPVSMALLVGLLLTYTQVRAKQEQVTTGMLWAAANPE
jgi:hypothetical protein